MIHARKDYDRIQDPDGKIPLDEPVFVIRGQDPIGAATVRYWARLYSEECLRQNEVPDQELLSAISVHAQKMDTWAEKANHGLATVDPGQFRLW